MNLLLFQPDRVTDPPFTFNDGVTFILAHCS